MEIDLRVMWRDSSYWRRMRETIHLLLCMVIELPSETRVMIGTFICHCFLTRQISSGKYFVHTFSYGIFPSEVKYGLTRLEYQSHIDHETKYVKDQDDLVQFLKETHPHKIVYMRMEMPEFLVPNNYKAHQIYEELTRAYMLKK